MHVLGYLPETCPHVCCTIQGAWAIILKVTYAATTLTSANDGNLS